MKNSEAFSSKQAAPSNLFVFTFLGLAAAGFADATYLTVKHFLGTTVPCSILHGCEQVLNSQYSTIYGVPLAMFGSFYYLTTMILIAIYLETKNLLLLKLASLLVASGFLISLGLVYLQVFIIKNICLYCMWSALTSTLLFTLSIIFWTKYNSPSSASQPPDLTEQL